MSAIESTTPIAVTTVTEDPHRIINSVRENLTGTPACEEVPTCPVCIEKYTKVRREVECPKCLNCVCHRCTQRYICETIEDPHCMHCKHPFDRQFLNSNLTKTFMSGEYVQKRREILWNREESYLPAAMAFIPLKKEKIANIAKRSELQKLIREMEVQLNELHNRDYDIERAIDTGVLPGAGTATVKESQQKFVRRCIKDGCKGWLSTGWKCDICESKVCSDCYQIKQETTTNPHVCKKDDLETADYIRKNAKNCPKCGEMIEKKEGCDQMFCTSCHTAFSWRTLEIVQGAIHNPHYFAWRQAQGVNERTIGDIQCGGVPDQSLFNFYSDLRHKYHIAYYDDVREDVFDDMDKKSSIAIRAELVTAGRRTYDNSERVYLTPHHKIYMVFTNICRHLEHMRSYTQRYGTFFYDEEERATKLRHMRLAYLSNDMSKEQFQVFLSSEEKKREKLRILSQPIDTLYNAGADILRRAVPSVSNVGVDMSKPENKTPENYQMLFEYGKRHIDEYYKLLEFINGIYKDISMEFNVKVPQIDKYCQDTMINLCKTAREERVRRQLQ